MAEPLSPSDLSAIQAERLHGIDGAASVDAHDFY